MWTVFKVFIEFVPVWLLFLLLLSLSCYGPVPLFASLVSVLRYLPEFARIQVW